MLKHSLVAALALALAAHLAAAQKAAAQTPQTADTKDGNPSGSNPPQGFSMLPIAPLRYGSTYWPGYLLIYSAPPKAPQDDPTKKQKPDQPAPPPSGQPPGPSGAQPPLPPGAQPPGHQPPGQAGDQSPKAAGNQSSGSGEMKVCYVIARTPDLDPLSSLAKAMPSDEKQVVYLLCSNQVQLPEPPKENRQQPGQQTPPPPSGH